MRDDDIDDTVVRRPRAPQAAGAPDDSDPLGDTVLRPVPSVAPIPPMPASVPAPGPTRNRSVDDDIDDEDPFGDTVIRSVPPVPSGGTPAAPPDDDPLGDTVIRAVRPIGAEVGPEAVDRVVGTGAPEDPEATVVRPRTGRSSAPDGSSSPHPPAPVAAPRVPSIRVAGRLVRLDRPVVVGRRPGLPRVLRGPEPVLLTVPSPTGQVSSSHVVVHAEGEVAVVEDLRSTNGTVVRPAGAAPFRMRSGASNVVLTGTVVEIGDGNVIEVLSPHLRLAPAADDLDPFPAPPPGLPATGTPRHPRERP